MKVKFISGVVPGLKIIEKTVNDFCDTVQAHDVKVSIAGAQVIVSISYTEKEKPFMVDPSKAEKKESKKSKAKEK